MFSVLINPSIDKFRIILHHIPQLRHFEHAMTQFVVVVVHLCIYFVCHAIVNLISACHNEYFIQTIIYLVEYIWNREINENDEENNYCWERTTVIIRSYTPLSSYLHISCGCLLSFLLFVVLADVVVIKHCCTDESLLLLLVLIVDTFVIHRNNSKKMHCKVRRIPILRQGIILFRSLDQWKSY